MPKSIKHYVLRATIALFHIGAVLLFVSCEDDDDDSNNGSSTSFARTTLLKSYDETIINSGLADFATSVTALEESVVQVSKDPTQDNLLKAQTDWITAAEAYASCYSINFGPGETLFGSFAENVGTFPANVDGITTKINESDTTQNDFARDTRGLYGLEYLLFQSNALTDITSANYAAYSRSVANDLNKRAQEMTDGWLGYQDGFITDNGTGSSSSITVLYNEWIKGYEFIKNFMVGIPSGLRIGQTEPAPEQVAGLYSKTSKELLRLHLLHIEAMYFGAELPEGNTAVGFDDYLLTTVGGDAVLAETKTQWDAIWEAYNALPQAPLDELVVTHPQEMENLYMELSKHTRFFKSELSSRLGLTITFDSGDGD